MKTFKSLIFIVSASLTINVNAQDMFKVLASKGTNTISLNGKTSKIVTGLKLDKNATIEVGANSYVGLVHNSGKAIEIKTAGVYKIAELSKKIIASNTTVAKKYTDFVMNELTSVGSASGATNITGSVERGSDDELLKAVCPNSTDILGNINLRWLPVTGAKSYIITISNMYEEPLMVKETTLESLSLDLNSNELKNQKALIWNVAVKDKPDFKSGNHALTFIEATRLVEINKNLADLKSEVTEETALNKVILAKFYEDNKLYLDAIDSYKAAMKIEPEVAEYKKVYNDFLTRVGLPNCVEK